MTELEVLASAGPGTATQKYAMRLMSGLEVGPPRFPLKTLSKESVDQLASDIESLNIDYAFKTNKVL